MRILVIPFHLVEGWFPAGSERGRFSFLRHAGSTQGQLKLTAIYCISIMVSHPLGPSSTPLPKTPIHPHPPTGCVPRTCNNTRGCCTAHSRFTVSFMEHTGCEGERRSNQWLTISSTNDCIIRCSLVPATCQQRAAETYDFMLPGKVVRGIPVSKGTDIGVTRIFIYRARGLFVRHLFPLRLNLTKP